MKTPARLAPHLTILLATFTVLSMACPASAQTTFVVDTTGNASDSLPGDGLCDDGGGSCSLRAAIQEANALAGADTIEFDIVGDPGCVDGICTIDVLNTALPPLIETLTIDGYTQLLSVPSSGDTDFDGFLAVRLITSGSASSDAGLSIEADDVLVRGLIVNNFNPLVATRSATAGATVEGNFLGYDPVDTLPDLSCFIAVFVDGTNHTVGGSTPASRNVIADCSTGVHVPPTASSITIAGNFIGLAPDGFTPIENTTSGISAEGTDQSIRANVVTASGTGIVVGDGTNAASAAVMANLVGVGADGTGGDGNTTGISVLPNATADIGLVQDEDEGNVVARSAGNGIEVSGSTGTRIAGNLVIENGSAGISVSDSPATTVAGNFVGIDQGGAAAPNGTGVVITTSPSALVGTDGDGTSDGSEGNVISGNTLWGLIVSNSDDIVVAGNFVGTDEYGITAIPNGAGGVLLQSSDSAVIGTDTDGVSDSQERNVVSGNGGDGLEISDAVGGTVAGNLVGLNVAGGSALPNAGNGIILDTCDSIVVGTDGDDNHDGLEGNVVSGNGSDGIEIESATSIVIAGNLVGTDLGGSSALPNGGDGIRVGFSSSGTRIGTDGDGISDQLEGNVISANSFAGVRLALSTDTSVAGNLIGTDSAGTGPLGNLFGVSVHSDATGAVIGTDGDGTGDGDEGNVIAANDFGLIIDGDANVVAGNAIGTDASGTIDLGNGAAGVELSFDAIGNRIGTDLDTVSDEVEANRIRFNDGAGVLVTGGSQNSVLGNAITDSGSLAIDLGFDGTVTPNDVDDADAGANDLQNFPVIDEVTFEGDVTAHLDTVAFTTFTIEYFANSLCDSSGHGEAAVLIGRQTNLTTDGDGHLDLAFSHTPIPGMPWITATATDMNGNTSELSSCVARNGVVIFSDDFESGDTSAWSTSIP